jgi:hypothetical protein
MAYRRKRLIYFDQGINQERWETGVTGDSFSIGSDHVDDRRFRLTYQAIRTTPMAHDTIAQGVLQPSHDRHSGPHKVTRRNNVVAQANPLSTLNMLNFTAEQPANAQAVGIAIRNPGRKRHATMNTVA